MDKPVYLVSNDSSQCNMIAAFLKSGHKMELLVGKENHLTGVEQKTETAKSAPVQLNRVDLYRQYFAEHAARSPAPGAFMHQVDGYGVQLFAQASSFASR